MISRNKTLLPLVLALLWPALLFSQHLTPRQTGGVYYAYPVESSTRIDIPDGFMPFYISHYGRHGSRWLPSEDRYTWVMSQLADKRRLTPLGRSVRRRMRSICRNARGNAGMLTPLGKRQHQGIARRMVANYPEVFQGQDTWVRARSSTVPRCRASMLAFCGELPCQGFTPETEARFMDYINYESPELKVFSARTRRFPLIDPTRFINALFTDASAVTDSLKLLSELHTIASDMQDIPLSISLWDIFTTEEMMAVHQANNERMTVNGGLTPLNDGIPARSSIPLWQNIVFEADSIIAAGGHGASLRFGHDTALQRLLTLLQLSLPGTGMEDILPMGANLQMLFCRNTEGAVLVAFLHNERVQKLPIPSAFNDFYLWSDVKTYMEQRIHNLEHQRQLSALNTMVGTAPANTRTAGLFGKGSEEHGQTLPAVLVPNGQTFWTPQTQATEQKCIAPYYYTDTLFQGIRASHWIVGGCTQDYGSFTVGVYGENGVYGINEMNGTPFSHNDEVSHPHYYALRLPAEQLFTELTALSHTAAIRVTPLRNQSVHIVIRTNSDEQQGTVTIDTLHHLILATNPVHRIYQGWGEPAGFSGHLVLSYTDDIVSYRLLPDAVVLTFQGQRGVPLSFTAATSFTSQQGALANLEAEGGTFEQMEQTCIDRWNRRLHTIDIDDPDTSRVNQFYGALYRASFLPREMSDADGSYPRFAGKTGKSGLSGKSGKTGKPGFIHYGDFSMWDTYRALHPLLNIIAPQESGQMMQSLVTMADEGGWMPIFPCWNSYTAAMIGDHCSSVLADAWVKGIRDFGAVKAYRFMRKNAFELPATFDDYKNGMGRRALDSYLRLGFIPLEDSVKEAFHQQEQTSRTLEYTYDDFCVAQMALALDTVSTLSADQRSALASDYRELMRRSENWRNVINPQTGWADGRHADGRWEQNLDVEHRKPYITEGATCHYTWYVPHNVSGLIGLMGGEKRFTARLDSMFTQRRYWHGNEPCHQVAWLFALAGQPAKTRQWVTHILQTEYNDTPGGLSGNDDAGQMSAWQVFAMMGFYPVCPATTQYVLASPTFRRITINQPGRRPFVISRSTSVAVPTLNGQPLAHPTMEHSQLIEGGTLLLPE